MKGHPNKGHPGKGFKDAVEMPDLDGMTKKQLLALAEEHGISVKPKEKTAVIREALRLMFGQ